MCARYSDVNEGRTHETEAGTHEAEAGTHEARAYKAYKIDSLRFLNILHTNKFEIMLRKTAN